MTCCSCVTQHEKACESDGVLLVLLCWLYVRTAGGRQHETTPSDRNNGLAVARRIRIGLLSQMPRFPIALICWISKTRVE